MSLSTKICEVCNKRRKIEEYKSENSTICNECRKERKIERLKKYINTNLGVEALDYNVNGITILYSKLNNADIISYADAVRMVKEGKANVYSSDTIYQHSGGKALVRNQGVCHYCGDFGDTVDHIIPQSKGGKDDEENLVCCCFDCNNLKGNKSYDEFVSMMKQYGKRVLMQIKWGKHKKKKVIKESFYSDIDDINNKISKNIEEKVNMKKPNKNLEDMMNDAFNKPKW